MGAVESADAAAPATLHDGAQVGFQVLQVLPGSPGQDAGLVQYLDFIISANTVRLDRNTDRFKQIIEASENQPMQLLVYNVKTDAVRHVTLTPRKWEGEGMLGLTIKFAAYEGAAQNVLFVEVCYAFGIHKPGLTHSQKVSDGSPAQLASLTGQEDYILGCRDNVFTSVDDLAAFVAGRSFGVFYVYNARTNAVREVVADWDHPWGDDGQRRGLGATVLHGKLHELPRGEPLPHTELRRPNVDTASQRVAVTVTTVGSSTMLLTTAAPASVPVASVDTVVAPSVATVPAEVPVVAAAPAEAAAAPAAAAVPEPSSVPADTTASQ